MSGRRPQLLHLRYRRTGRGIDFHVVDRHLHLRVTTIVFIVVVVVVIVVVVPVTAVQDYKVHSLFQAKLHRVGVWRDAYGDGQFGEGDGKACVCAGELFCAVVTADKKQKISKIEGNESKRMNVIKRPQEQPTRGSRTESSLSIHFKDE